MSGFVWLVFPYIALGLAIAGGLYRYFAYPFTYSSLSSQLVEPRWLYWGSVPWHYGIVPILLAHLLAGLFPSWAEAILRHPIPLVVLELIGYALAFFTIVGIVTLILRRAAHRAARAVTSPLDWILLVLLALQVLMGIGVALTERWGSRWYLATAAPWFWSLVRLSPDARTVVPLPGLAQAHFVNGFVIILLFPFTRLVHLVSIPLGYLWRPYQLVVWNHARPLAHAPEATAAGPGAWSGGGAPLRRDPAAHGDASAHRDPPGHARGSARRDPAASREPLAAGDPPGDPPTQRDPPGDPPEPGDPPGDPPAPRDPPGDPPGRGGPGADPPDPPDPRASRRRFLVGLSVFLGGIAALIVAVPAVGFILGLRKAPMVWRAVGRVDDFTPGTTREVSFLDPSPLPWAGVSAKTAAWLRRDGPEDFIAFAVNCTHLGCPVRWLQDAELFMCPCHGGVFYRDGRVAAGPPPRPLTRYPVRVRAGVVEILTSPLPIT